MILDIVDQNVSQEKEEENLEIAKVIFHVSTFKAYSWWSIIYG